MRVAIDARELQDQPTGVGRYLAGLLEAWNALPAATPHEFILCAPAGRGGGTFWEQVTLPQLVRKAGADILFAPAYTGPLLCPVPMVVAIHDVSFAAHPEWFGRREGLRRRALVRLAAWRATRVVTISQFSKREIARRLSVLESKIDVIYPGTHTSAATPGGVGRDPLVLYVGSLFTRRHIPELIEGFARFAQGRRDIRLEIVGDNRTTPHIDLDRVAAASGAGERIALRSYLPDAALAALYARARAFVFLSEYEGFGLTPLEALAAGIPIVVLDTPVAREVYRDAALYVPQPDPALIAAAIQRVLFDEAERMRILEAAQRTLPRYSWHVCAERVLDVLIACRNSR